LSGAPLFHIAGVSGFGSNLATGATTVLTPSGGFDPIAMVDLLERERVSSCFFVPAQWAAIIAVPGLAERDLSALRRCSWGAAPASTTLLRAMIDAFPQADIVTAFGQTECSPVTCFLRGEDSLRKIGSVGTPMLNVEVRVVDEAMDDVPRGEVGEIVYRSPMVMKEYWNQPEATAEAFAGGWFHSGDLVRSDDEGYLFVVDRIKDVVNTGGVLVASREVEDALYGHAAVAEVAVVGLPHERWIEAIAAVVVLKEDVEPQALIDYAKGRLAPHKVPKSVHRIDELPKNASGKVLKRELRRQLGGSESAVGRGH
jgi:fatty-acyl-CoA synthase/long-chain acyl-CoA synthetase